MSCSSKRKRLVGSCINTLVSSTKSFWARPMRGVAPGLPAGLTDLRATRVKGAGRILRSTMSLLGDGGYVYRISKDASHRSAHIQRIQALGVVTAPSHHPLW